MLALLVACAAAQEEAPKVVDADVVDAPAAEDPSADKESISVEPVAADEEKKEEVENALVEDKPVEAAEVTKEVDEGPAYVHEDIPAEPYVHEDIAAEPYVHLEPLPAPAVVMVDPNSWLVDRLHWGGGLTTGYRRFLPAIPATPAVLPSQAIVNAPLAYSWPNQLTFKLNW